MFPTRSSGATSPPTPAFSPSVRCCARVMGYALPSALPSLARLIPAAVLGRRVASTPHSPDQPSLIAAQPPWPGAAPRLSKRHLPRWSAAEPRILSRCPTGREPSDRPSVLRIRGLPSRKHPGCELLLAIRLRARPRAPHTSTTLPASRLPGPLARASLSSRCCPRPEPPLFGLSRWPSTRSLGRPSYPGSRGAAGTPVPVVKFRTARTIRPDRVFPR